MKRKTDNILLIDCLNTKYGIVATTLILLPLGDEPIMAPKERDLMFISGGVANVWNNLREEDFFIKATEALTLIEYSSLITDMNESYRIL